LIFLLFGCGKHSENICIYEKALISDKDFCQSAIEPGEAIIPLGYPFDFDTLLHLSQIDTLIQEICKSKTHDCSGYISLKYIYKQDTIYIPAFSYQCDCHVSFSRRNTFNIYLNNDSCYVRNEILNTKKISFNKYSDSLLHIFSNTFANQLEYWNKRRDYFNNIDSLKEYRRSGLYIPSLNIELNDDSEIQNVSKYIDVAYDIYFDALNESFVENYHKELCVISHEEFKLFSFGMFFRIIILPKYQPPVFILEN
jgi:hypothetical protein